MSTGTSVVEIRDLGKRYLGTVALDGVSLSFEPGSIVALAGENGAGKSTLIRLLAGVERPTSGSLVVDGQEVQFRRPSDAHDQGISVVSQEFRLVPQLSVADNMMLGREQTRFALIDGGRTRREVRTSLERLGVDIDPSVQVGRLSVADQQMVEIARALSRDFRLLVLDEPTAALHAEDASRLLDLLVRLRSEGTSVLYVSHHLDEVLQIADRIVVLRDGHQVGELQTPQSSERELVELMLGKELETLESATARAADSAEPFLEVEGLTCRRVRTPLTFSVSRGEVLGLAGLAGSGRTDVMSALFGLESSSGRVRLGDADLDVSDPASLIRAGVVMVSEDRKGAGIFSRLSLLDNLMVTGVPERTRPLGLRRAGGKAERKRFEQARRRLDVRCDSPHQAIRTLSGGNQQKILLGRAMESQCRLLLLNEPTRGVDVGAKVEIYGLVRELAASGMTVIVSSSDASELAALVDRCLVMNTGQVVADLAGDRLTESALVTASVQSIMAER